MNTRAVARPKCHHDVETGKKNPFIFLKRSTRARHPKTLVLEIECALIQYGKDRMDEVPETQNKFISISAQRKYVLGGL